MFILCGKRSGVHGVGGSSSYGLLVDSNCNADTATDDSSPDIIADYFTLVEMLHGRSIEWNIAPTPSFDNDSKIEAANVIYIHYCSYK